MRRGLLRPLLAAVLAGLAGLAAAGGFVDRFETAWRLVDERYWDLERSAVDWDEARVRYGASVAEVSSDDALYALLEAMYEEIGDDHTVFVRPERVAEFRERYGDLPCIGVFGLTPPTALETEPTPEPLSFAGPVGYALLPDGTGYLRLADLVASGTAAGVRGAVDALVLLGADAFVLDLRGNPGGRLVTMMQVAGVFTGGFLWRAVTTWSLPIPYPAVGVTATEAPLAVLVDEAVNSAAEGLAGGLQMQGRALVVGATTAGNVEAVLPFCLRDGSQAWVATGVLAPIGGPTWEGRGVEPDHPVDPQLALATALEALRKAR
jgi:carboxyl-terminal processing protease